MQLFLNRAMRAFSPKSQNFLLDITKKRQERRKKALKAADPKNKKFNRETFEEGEEVIIQDQITKKWEKRGKVKSSRKINTRQGHRSYVIETPKGKEYVRNGKFLTRPAREEE